jgi:hypothetical protein
MVSLPGFPVNTRGHPRVQALRMLISTGKKPSVYWKYDARRRHPALPVDKQDFGMSCFCNPAQATGMLPHHGTQYQGIRCDLRSQPALGLGALGLGRGTGGSALPFLRSAVRSHGRPFIGLA